MKRLIRQRAEEIKARNGTVTNENKIGINTRDRAFGDSIKRPQHTVSYRVDNTRTSCSVESFGSSHGYMDSMEIYSIKNNESNNSGNAATNGNDEYVLSVTNDTEKLKDTLSSH